jgi:small GTP-binding protein
MYKLSIWDTAGQEQHHALNTIYYRGAQGALIVYDITDIDSFQKMEMWVKELRQQCGSQLPIIIVGNKSDLESNRQIKLTDAEDYAKQLGVQHFSASARTGSNIKEIFKALTESK